jgi:broad specificity phosphatase PhoE
MPQTVWIARHANRLDFVNPEWFDTAPKRYDPPLSADGLWQAARLGERLKNESIEHIFASPFLRTIQTADCIAKALDLTVKIEKGLGEWLHPQWISEHPSLNHPESTISEYPRLDRHYASKILPQYPETESQLQQRTAEAVKFLVEEYSRDILLISHADPIKAVILALIGDNNPSAIPIQVPLCSLFKIVRDRRDRWQVEICGDTSHLA